MAGVDGALVETMTLGINAPVPSQSGYFARALTDAFGVSNLAYYDLPLLLATPKLGANLADADASIAVAAGNARILPVGTLTANRQITLATTGATAGELILLVRLDIEPYTLAIVNGGAGAGTKYTFPVSVARAAEFTFDGTNWNLLRHWAI